MHLARSSHHPASTFAAILQGEAQRILRNNSNESTWLHNLNTFRIELAARGYSEQELVADFINAYKFSDRQRLLQPKEAKRGQAVLALKLPYTPRTDSLNAQVFLKKLQEAALSDPAAAASLSGARWLVAHARTSSLRMKLQAK